MPEKNTLFTRLRTGDKFDPLIILEMARRRVSVDPQMTRYRGDLICNFLHRAMDHIRLDSTTEDLWDIIHASSR